MNDSDPAVRRRYRAIYNEIERAGGLDVAQTVASLAIHLEQRRHARIERSELLALTALLGLVMQNMSERAAKEQDLMEAVG